MASRAVVILAPIACISANAPSPSSAFNVLNGVLTSATRRPRSSNPLAATNAIFRHHAEHNELRVRVGKFQPLDHLFRVRIVEDVERLLFEDDLLILREVCGN